MFHPFTTEENAYPDQLPEYRPRPTATNPRSASGIPLALPARTSPSVDRFRQVNAFAHLNRAYERVIAGGVFPPFSDQMTVKLDQNTDDNSANFT